MPINALIEVPARQKTVPRGNSLLTYPQKPKERKGAAELDSG